MALPFEHNPTNVLITGGSAGIGMALASRYLSTGARVLVTGRSRERLDRAAAEFPGLETFVGDVGLPGDREALARHVMDAMPGLDILINNAGIQRRVSLAADVAPWGERQTEIDVLLAGPIHLNYLLVPVMLAHRKPGIIANVTSGGAYLPQPFAPVYSACKAALHSYTVSLRHALSNTRCRVVEIIPPAVQTQLAGADASHGVPLDDFVNATFAALTTTDAVEIGYGFTDSEEFKMPKRLYQVLFRRLSERFPVKIYP